MVLKAAHTVIWATVEAAVLYLLWSGVTRRTDRRAVVAAAVVAVESATFLANGARCPLTLLAESLGSEHGSVTDVYLPRWFAHNLPAIHVPVLVAIVWLHARNLRRVPHTQGAVASSRTAVMSATVSSSPAATATTRS